MLNPATGEVIGHAPAGTAADVATAVDAASAAFPEWRAVPPADRIQYLFRLKQLLDDVIDVLMQDKKLPEKVVLSNAPRPAKNPFS